MIHPSSRTQKMQFCIWDVTLTCDIQLMMQQGNKFFVIVMKWRLLMSTKFTNSMCEQWRAHEVFTRSKVLVWIKFLCVFRTCLAMIYLHLIFVAKFIWKLHLIAKKVEDAKNYKLISLSTKLSCLLCYLFGFVLLFMLIL